MTRHRVGQQLKGHLDPLLLAILEDGPAHGYGIIEQLHNRSGGAFDLPEGTVYPALHRLEGAGVLASSHERIGGRDRRVYRLTRRGRKVLAERRNEWDRFASSVTMILGVSPA